MVDLKFEVSYKRTVYKLFFFTNTTMFICYVFFPSHFVIHIYCRCIVKISALFSYVIYWFVVFHPILQSPLQRKANIAYIF